jgi:predicted helicase
MAPEKGNKHAASLKTLEQKERAFKSFCAHLSAGNPEWGWNIDEDDLKCTAQTLLKYIEAEPNVFKPILKEIAHSKAFQSWFDIGKQMAKGELKGNTSPTTWALIMRNMFSKFGWWDAEDKKDVPNAAYVNSIKDLFVEIKAASSKPSTEDTEPPLDPEE